MIDKNMQHIYELYLGKEYDALQHGYFFFSILLQVKTFRKVQILKYCPPLLSLVTVMLFVICVCQAEILWMFPCSVKNQDQCSTSSQRVDLVFCDLVGSCSFVLALHCHSILQPPSWSGLSWRFLSLLVSCSSLLFGLISPLLLNINES